MMPTPTIEQFEAVLTTLCARLTEACRRIPHQQSAVFERAVRTELQILINPYEGTVNFDPHPYAFPDIVVWTYGIEVKFTTNDTWRSIANSVFESTRTANVENIYLLFGKMGGEPEVKWGKYDDCVIHVRTSHVPRFEVQIPDVGGEARESLFRLFGVEYADFCQLPIPERMEHIRTYARGRLKDGEHLWWLDDKPDLAPHTLPLQVRLYMNLETEEKRRLRAEAALLCPQIVKPSRAKTRIKK